MTEILENTEVEIKNEIVSFVDRVNDLQVVDKETFDEAGAYMLHVKRLTKKIKEYFKPLKDAANKAHKELTSRERQELNPLQEAELQLTTRRMQWKSKEDERLKAIQEELQEIERKKAEKEREKLLKKAVKVEDEERQEELLEQAEQVTAKPVFVEKTVEKTSDIIGGGKSTWVKDVKVSVTDARALCQEIITGNVPITVIDFKIGKLKSFVKTMAIKPNQIKGLHVEEIQRESIRT